MIIFPYHSMLCNIWSSNIVVNEPKNWLKIYSRSWDLCNNANNVFIDRLLYLSAFKLSYCFPCACAPRTDMHLRTNCISFTKLSRISHKYKFQFLVSVSLIGKFVKYWSLSVVTEDRRITARLSRVNTFRLWYLVSAPLLFSWEPVARFLTDHFVFREEFCSYKQ
jgi:hypothetical protein